jgi:alpha-acetolactate decarboxylase
MEEKKEREARELHLWVGGIVIGFVLGFVIAGVVVSGYLIQFIN